MLTIAATNIFLRFAVLALVFGLVALAAFAVMAFVARRASVRTGLQNLGVGNGIGPRTTTLRGEHNDSAWAKLADRIERAGLNLADTKSDRLRSKLIAAGYTSAAAPRVFTMIRLGLVFILPLSYVLTAYAGSESTATDLYLYGTGLAAAGLYLPNLFVNAKADRRREEIVNGFPDCLDLLLVCVQAGLGIEAAMDRVGREMTGSHPLVAELLSITTLQLRAGASREEAFRALSDRASVDEIKSFTTLLIQSDKLGTSVSTTLRVYSAEMRERRRMNAEEKAHRLPVLISIPLVVCMLPTMIGVLMLPAAVRVVRDLLPGMTGG